MQVSGTGITTFDIDIKPDFKPDTELAIQWNKLASGNYIGTDRGSASDIYNTTIELYGKEPIINNFIAEINNNDILDANQITLSNFSDTEKIFGCNVDYTGSIDAVILKMGKKKQRSFRGFSIDVTLRALSPSFVGSAEFPTLKCLQPGWEGDEELSLDRYDSYEGDFTTINFLADSGYFIGTFIFTEDQMINLRNFIRTTRSDAFTLDESDILGVDYPFGVRAPTRTAYPAGYAYNVKLIDWRDQGMYGVNRWIVTITLAEQLVPTWTT